MYAQRRGNIVRAPHYSHLRILTSYFVYQSDAYTVVRLLSQNYVTRPEVS